MSMKGAIILVMAMLVAVPVMAQDKQISFGVKAGLNMANLTYDPEPVKGPDNLLGIAAGGVLSFNLSPSLSLDGEVVYMQKGASSKYESELCTSDERPEAHVYLDFADAALQVPRRERHALRVGRCGVRSLDERQEHGYQRLRGRDGDYDLDVKDYFKGTDMGISFGAGVEFAMGSSALFFEGRYAMGLSDIAETPAGVDMDEDTGSTKTKGIYLFGGMRF